MPIEPGIELKKDEILKRITEEQIFERYLGIPVEEDVNLINPLRVDGAPGCRFYRNNQGRLRFNDFSKRQNLDCFAVVQLLYNCNFIDALKIIVSDFKVNKETINHNIEQIPIVKKRVKIEITVRAWESEDLDYWGQYHIKSNQLSGNVACAKAIWLNGEYYRCRKSDPCYVYYFGKAEDGFDLFKLYFPKRKKGNNRFYTNVRLEDNVLQGYNLLPSKGLFLINTKSFKDILSLKSFDIPAVAPQSEGQLLTPDQYIDLAGRFQFIFSLGDNDKAGRGFCINHQLEYKIPYFVFPFTMKKDFSDNVKEYGVQRMWDIINHIKQEENLI